MARPASSHAAARRSRNYAWPSMRPERKLIDAGPRACGDHGGGVAPRRDENGGM